MADMGEVILAAVLSMGKIIVVTSIGVFCATRPKGNPLFDAELLPRLGRLCNLVFLPAMVSRSTAINQAQNHRKITTGGENMWNSAKKCLRTCECTRWMRCVSAVREAM
eukprot:TRINITY_DN50_c1_g1_i5.p3 TRINITY_DN50_c1_g1~~TRINITY_DN50_c1_g1_i5.p3  ORF type:complete len:109 (-),score=8.72 TRINITY_DN50_c1_g1_i5:1543-1869(-)